VCVSSSDASSYLEYLPDPQIPFPGSRCGATMTVTLVGEGVAVMSDSFLQHDPAGREENFSVCCSEIVVDTAEGEALAIDRLKGRRRRIPRQAPWRVRRLRGPRHLGSCWPNLPIARIAGERRTISLDYAEAAIGASQLPKSRGCWCGAGRGWCRPEAGDASCLERDASRAQGLSPGGAAQVEGSGESQANTPAEKPSRGVAFAGEIQDP
jgi:hypothetical protein